MYLAKKNKKRKAESEEKDEQGPSTKRQGMRGKSGIQLDHSLLNSGRPKRERKSVVKDFDFGDKHDCWTLSDKEKLLEALYRHSHQAYESIAHVVKTKTAKQVEKFIEKNLNSSCMNYKTRIVELDPAKGAAPLELWLSLVQELVLSDKRLDHSRHYTQILKVIGQNEPMPEESGFQDLNWRNLYKFMSDLLADKAVLQPLSNMESLVLLDMMHSMGDTLHTSDTTQQRRILDLKYQLFRQQILCPKDREFSAAYNAINNDFSSVGYKTKNSGASTSSAKRPAGQNITIIASSSQQQQPSTSFESDWNSQSIQILSPSSSSLSPVTVNSNDAQTHTEDKEGNTTVAMFNQNQDASDNSTTAATPESETNLTSIASTPLSPSVSTLEHDDGAKEAKEVVLSENTTASETTTAEPSSATTSSTISSSSFSSPSSHKDSKNSTTSTTTTSSSHSQSIPNEIFAQPSSSDLLSNNNDKDTVEEPDDEDKEEEEEFTDTLPKLFSLNPLTIPPSLLFLRPKNFPEQNDTPIILENKH